MIDAIGDVPLDQVVAAFTVEGEPVPWSRAGRGPQGQTFTPRRYADWRRRCREQIMLTEAPSFDDSLGLAVFVYRRTRRHADADNFLKAVMDAGNGIAWSDDHLITEAYVRVEHDAARPRVEAVAYRAKGGSSENEDRRGSIRSR